MLNADAPSVYCTHVARLEQRLSPAAARSQAVGGEFAAIGQLEFQLLRSLGLPENALVVDVGCGSGRLASQLASMEQVRYVGCDVVPNLLAHAQEICKRPDWQFLLTDGAVIPCANAQADFVCFFSVFTHLSHEGTFRYLREAQRVLRPHGLLVMSFLEFSVGSHWEQFIASVDGTRADDHWNQFISRDAIETWARHTGFEVSAIFPGDSTYIPLPEEVRFESGVCMSGAGSLGQSVAVLRKQG